MSVLVDTGVLYAHHDADAARHDAAVGAMDAVLDGEFGHPYVSEYVFDEVVTLTRKRTDSFDAALTIAKRIRGVDGFPRVFELLHVDRHEFQSGIDVFERYDDQSLSFTDAVIVAICERRDIDGVVSFDSDFDGLVTRFDPGDYS